MLVTKTGKGEGLGTEGNTPSINVEIRGLNTVNTHLLLYVPTLCLAWQLLNLNSFFWLWQFSSPCLSLSALKQKFACWSTGCRRYVCYEFQTCFFSKKIAFINTLSNKQKSEVNYKYLPALLSLAGGEKLPTEAQRRCEHDFVFNSQTFHYSHSSVRDFLIWNSTTLEANKNSYWYPLFLNFLKFGYFERKTTNVERVGLSWGVSFLAAGTDRKLQLQVPVFVHLIYDTAFLWNNPFSNVTAVKVVILQSQHITDSLWNHQPFQRYKRTHWIAVGIQYTRKLVRKPAF